MKHAGWLLSMLGAVAAALGYWASCSLDGARAVAAPPLSLKGYLDEKLPEAPEKGAGILVNNDACYVCHANLKEEELVVSHGREKIGCVACHGRSEAHTNDEDNVTPPEKMYALGDIDKMCSTCHETHLAPAGKVIARWQERCPSKTNPKEIVCTDCHYQHRLRFRTVSWDKKTRQLIVRKDNQRIKPAAGGAQDPPGGSK